MAGSHQPSQDFLKVYDTIRDQLLADPMMLDQPETARTWFRKVGMLWMCGTEGVARLPQMLDYNVPGGKLNRGMAVLDALQAVKGANTVRMYNAGRCYQTLHHRTTHRS